MHQSVLVKSTKADRYQVEDDFMFCTPDKCRPCFRASAEGIDPADPRAALTLMHNEFVATAASAWLIMTRLSHT